MAVQKVKPEKATREIKIRIGEDLYAALKDYAAQMGYDELSPAIRLICRRHVFGHLSPNRDLLAAGVRDE